MNNNQARNTKGQDYTERLVNKQTVWWKRLLDVQAPYRWNIRRLKPGFTLDLGCGIGRNLNHIKGHGVGIDYNDKSVELCKSQGLTVFTPVEFQTSKFNDRELFDSILFAHVAEHMTQQEAIALLKTYLPLLKREGKVILICPQEAGYKSDATHVEFVDFSKLHEINNGLGLKIVQQYSFPFPRFVGRFFTYNEFIVVSCKNDIKQDQ